MTRKIFTIAIVICSFSGVFSLKALSLEKQNKAIKSAEGIVEKERVGRCNPLSIRTYFEEAEEELSTELVEFKTGRGVTLKYVLVRPDNPLAIAILLPGGSGTLDISGSTNDFVIGAKNDFMVRNRNNFAQNGFLVTLIDAPSDMEPEGMTPEFRAGLEHAQDIQDVISHVKEEADLPIWISGISMATYSAANIAIRLKEEIQGLVLASSSTQPGGRVIGDLPYPNGILDLELDKIIAPTLIVAHEDDQCPGTPPSGAPKIQNALTNVEVVEIEYFTGGNEPESGPCGPLAPHCFYGIDEEVISTIADFIVSAQLTTTTTTIVITITTTTTAKTPCPVEEIYGEDSEETELLRYFRDVVLSATAERREIIKLYYEWSPTIIKAIEEDKEFKEGVKAAICGIVKLIGKKYE